MHPKPGGNCFNWVLGHVVAHRNAVLAALRRPPISTAEEAAPYARGSRPLAETDARDRSRQFSRRSTGRNR